MLTDDGKFISRGEVLGSADDLCVFQIKPATLSI